MPAGPADPPFASHGGGGAGDPSTQAQPRTGRLVVAFDEAPETTTATGDATYRTGRLTWSGQPVTLGRQPVVLGLSGHGQVVAPPDEPAVALLELRLDAGRFSVRAAQPNAECAVNGAPLTADPLRLTPGDELTVAGERFRFEATPEPQRSTLRVVPERSPPIELRITLVDERGHDHDLVLTARADDRVDHAVAEAATAAGIGAVEGIVNERTGARVRGDDHLASADLRWGDRVRVRRGAGRLPAPQPGGQLWDGPRLAINRAPRLLRALPAVAVEVPAPPDESAAPRFPVVLSVLPLIAGIVMAVVMKSPFFLIFAVLTPVTAAASYFGDRQQGHARYTEREATYRRSIAAIDEYLTQAYTADGQHRVVQAPGLDVLAPRATTQRTALWERRASDPDFLSLRVGTGSLPFGARITYASGGSEHLRYEGRTQLERFAVLHNVPITVGLPQVGVCGVPGPAPATAAVLRGLIVQAALLHSPADLVVVAATSHRHRRDWEWLKWLPHVAAGADLLDGPPLATGEIAAHALLERVHRQQQERLGADPDPRGTAHHGPHVLVLVDGALALDGAVTRAVVASARATRVSVLWSAERQHDLPLDTGAILSLTSETTLDVLRADGEQDVLGVRSEPLGPGAADAIARSLAPLLDQGARGRDAGVPASVQLLELLRLDDLRPERIAERWSRSSDALAAPVGATASGAFSIDLRRDGPHALVVGTTGSGKSELLRSIVCALAADHPPTRVSFLLFDYKGGAAFGPCRALPHVVDVVSDLDDHLSHRALVALDAELMRRERILAEFGAKDLDELGAKAPEHRPPALVLAVDEFAKLRDEVPEFVDGIVDIAQRGRSLGVHMILASQTLGNAFTPRIRGNTNLRLTLRAADEAQSLEALGTSDAAHIPSGPEYSGRGFARAGAGRLEEFQSAYVSGSSADAEPSLRVAAFGSSGSTASDTTLGPSRPVSAGPTDLERLAEAIASASRQLGLTPPPAPWLPPLPDELPDDGLAIADAHADAIPIGLIDEPRRQRQAPLVLEPAASGLTVVYGASGSGRSTVLRTIAGQVARACSPGDVQLYAIDAAGRSLTGLADLPHCAAVTGIADRERLARSLERLTDTIAERARRFGAAGVTSLAGYREHRPDDACPRLLLLIDDVDELLRAIDGPAGASLVDRLLTIVSSGRPVGVSVVATCASRGGLSAPFQPHVDRRIVLRMTTPEDAMGVGVDPDVARAMRRVPGRAVIDGSLEAQIAHVGPAAAGTAQLTELRRLADHAAARWPDARAPRIAPLPDHVDRGTLAAPRSLAAVPVGVGGAALTAVTVDLSDGHLLISGPRRSGRSTALVTIAAALAAIPAPGVQVGLIAPRRSPLSRMPHDGPRPDDLEGIVALMVEATVVIEERDRNVEHQPIVLLVDDAGDISDPRFLTAAETVARRGPDVGVHLVVAADRTTARGFSHPWVRKIATDGQGIVLQPEDPAQADHLGVELPRHESVPMVPGRGYAVRDGAITIVQLGTGDDA